MKIVKAVKAGPLANGFERGKGRIVHAIKSYTEEVYAIPSLCGDMPSISWSERPDCGFSDYEEEGLDEEEMYLDSNPTVDNRERRKDLKCSFCPPNKGDNAKRKSKHGKAKPKVKAKRKGKL